MAEHAGQEGTDDEVAQLAGLAGEALELGLRLLEEFVLMHLPRGAVEVELHDLVEIFEEILVVDDPHHGVAEEPLRRFRSCGLALLHRLVDVVPVEYRRLTVERVLDSRNQLPVASSGE